jgi:PKD repeat protein
MSKLLLPVLLLFLSSSIFAGHEKGGVILRYESVAAVNNNPLEYVLEAYAVFETGGIPSPASISVSVSSSCFPNSSISLPKIGALNPLITADYCTPGTNIGATSGVALYRDTVILPGTCSDFSFSYTGNAGRYFQVSNVDDNFSGNSFFEVQLNNTLGPNTCPSLPTSDMALGLCINQPQIVYGFNETDGDSLYFTPSAPQRFSGGSVSNYPYKSGFSQNNQFGTSSPFSVNTQTGVLSASISSQGNYIVTIRYREYRKDTLGNTIEIADGRFSLLVIGATTCVVPPGKIKHLSVAGSDSVPCGRSSIDLAVNRRLAVSTIAPDGSDFIVFDASGPRLVQGAVALADTVIRLTMLQPLPSGVTLAVTIDTGTDGNVLVSTCGNHYQSFQDTLLYYSKGVGSALASYTYSYTSTPLQVSYNALASTADSVYWDFGDGSPGSSLVSPVHNYPFAGIFSVSLTAYSDCGAMDVMTQSVHTCDSLTASFSVSNQGDTLVFTAISNGAVGVFWDFGDGNTDSVQGATNVYAAPGSYYVQMTVFNPCGDTLIIGDTINTCAAPVSAWTYTIVSTGGTGMLVDFDGTASQNAATWLWDFGDGNTNSMSLNPTHNYATPGLNYLVSLTVTNACGETTTYAYRLSEVGLESEEISIGLYPNPVNDLVHADIAEIRMNFDHVVVRDLKGSVLLKEEIVSDHLTLNLSGLIPGSYILEFEGSSSVISEKIVIHR